MGVGVDLMQDNKADIGVHVLPIVITQERDQRRRRLRLHAFEKGHHLRDSGAVFASEHGLELVRMPIPPRA
jgi:hypothetical protein